MKSRENPSLLNIKVFRLAAAFWLAGWYCKITFYYEYLWSTAVRYPLEYSFFPFVLQDAAISQTVYLLPVAALIIFMTEDPRAYLSASVVMLVSSLLMSWHMNTHNDATFVVSFWVAVWLFWLAANLKRAEAEFKLHIVVLAQCLCAMIFLGGFMGKLTPEYWHGDVFYHTHIIENNLWWAARLKQTFNAEQLQGVAMVFSRAVIGMEGLLVLSPFLPSRFVCRFAPLCFSLIMFTNTWRIFSVLGCLMGMLLACLLLENSKKNA
ncbi:MAG: hypothetical protein A2787_04570 [Omnitrophica WOR_2 bacterium RIFCSPHIGHO2_01_FULL_48_9]|uniref:HTTM domain-containing protein n=1 Tax=Candidatus Sungbacteria bacterium RIFCSPHIGHO2_02_FULL_47_11 TaxID=1802270 RepID=A0A1G2KFB7_9BACT|nr:MAG: hypothetical protein A2787_04570 [Omnitrophica WOR_2 bacterium RIFCSPHIGHO2_01_FULL_48_9]OGZ98139.1 MAG: hypothetical protein A3C07_04940 [Candidatus Sungbacteria bacterium RIFCSPHIGHO2_02_FULL_47_11]